MSILSTLLSEIHAELNAVEATIKAKYDAVEERLSQWEKLVVGSIMATFSHLKAMVAHFL